ncbi:hypothetical protein Cha6605_4531 [Chamaesiphon minutus PCC 6605]|uniref:Uncharacterized protein n=1 Tax=Chamaesiphon minutus (strain ATCC 27169 / PCC 6605) TaxID=1173020 RepID=K9UK32_CHAP6|nr:hypothetical protein Cha6605_4531 [Chamaesiphon minutus PCC 6605]
MLAENILSAKRSVIEVGDGKLKLWLESQQLSTSRSNNKTFCGDYNPRIIGRISLAVFVTEQGLFCPDYLGKFLTTLRRSCQEKKLK